MISKFKKIIAILILSSFLFTPLGVSAAGLIMGDIWYFLKNFVILPLTRPWLWALDGKITNWLTSVALKDPTGIAPQLFAGNSLIIGNPRNYGIFNQQRGEDIFRALLARSRLCPYFDQDLKRVFGANLIPQDVLTKIKQRVLTRISDQIDFDVAISCTMPPNFNIREFANDFSKGGWAAWDKLILEPQNNPYGAFFLSLAEFENQRNFEEKIYTQIEGQTGFIGRRKPCEGEGTSGRCLLMGQIVTPADILGETAAKKIDKIPGGIIQSEDIASIITAIINSVWNAYANKVLSLLDEGGIQDLNPSVIQNQAQQIQTQSQAQTQQIIQQIIGRGCQFTCDFQRQSCNPTISDCEGEYQNCLSTCTGASTPAP